MGNKVKFNICNVHYAAIAAGEDGLEYYVINNNMGYDGDLELAMIPESFRTEILREEADENKVLVENCNSETGRRCFLKHRRLF